MSLDSKFTRVWDTEKLQEEEHQKHMILVGPGVMWYITKIYTKSALKENQFLLCIIHMIYVKWVPFQKLGQNTKGKP